MLSECRSHESTPSARKSTSSARVALAGTRRGFTPQIAGDVDDAGLL